MGTFIKMPPEKLLEAVKLADTYPMDAARLLCDWWNQVGARLWFRREGSVELPVSLFP